MILQSKWIRNSMRIRKGSLRSSIWPQHATKGVNQKEFHLTRLPCLSKYQDLPAVKLLVIGQWTQVICSPGRWRPLSSWSKKFLYTLISRRSISPLVSIPFPALTWHRDIRYTQQGNQTSLACAPLTLPLLINRGVSLWMSRSSRPRAYLYSMLLKSENETEWKERGKWSYRNGSRGLVPQYFLLTFGNPYCDLSLWAKIVS